MTKKPLDLESMSEAFDKLKDYEESVRYRMRSKEAMVRIDETSWNPYEAINSQMEKYYGISLSYLSESQLEQLIIHLIGYVDFDSKGDMLNLDELFGWERKTNA